MKLLLSFLLAVLACGPQPQVWVETYPSMPKGKGIHVFPVFVLTFKEDPAEAGLSSGESGTPCSGYNSSVLLELRTFNAGGNKATVGTTGQTWKVAGLSGGMGDWLAVNTLGLPTGALVTISGIATQSLGSTRIKPFTGSFVVR